MVQWLTSLCIKDHIGEINNIKSHLVFNPITLGQMVNDNQDLVAFWEPGSTGILYHAFAVAQRTWPRIPSWSIPSHITFWFSSKPQKAPLPGLVLCREYMHGLGVHCRLKCKTEKCKLLCTIAEIDTLRLGLWDAFMAHAFGQRCFFWVCRC